MTDPCFMDTPDDLRRYTLSELTGLCSALRTYLIDHVSAHGGHFSSSLGVVELTVALHYVFDTPEDKIVWDVGHQAYAHKLLTGRGPLFHTNRLLDGISGFPCRSESDFDAFGTGHSSTSLSAVLGMACAARLQGNNTRKHIAVIGDGAMTAGQAFEALNNAGYENADMLVILNDNNMSIDANTGALQHYLSELTTGKQYNNLKSRIKKMLSPDDATGPAVMLYKLEKILKGGLLRYSNLFEALSIRYFGPIDGHDLKKLTRILEKLKHIPGPKLLHCVTEKGRGFAPAMEHKAQWHATSAFDKHTGIRTGTGNATTFQEVFGNTLIELAGNNPRIVAISPAMLSGSALSRMKREMPDRVFDTGITEQHAVTFAAGLATDGLLPFCTIYSTFLQRAYDQVIHDVALQQLDVVFCIDRAGVVGPDGPTHHGAFDIAYLRCIPGITGAAPMDLEDLRNLLFTVQAGKSMGPFAIRYPKAAGNGNTLPPGFRELECGKGRRIRSGKDIAILSLGAVGQYVQEACAVLEKEHLDIAHYDLRFFKPLDDVLLHGVSRQFSTLVTIEDGCINGGVGSAVLEFIAEHGYQVRVKRLGLPDTFATQGTQQQLHALYGYDQQAIITLVRSLANDIHRHKPADEHQAPGFTGNITLV
ncbi:1-deoxy-D-xylulose-5-phosphate synthase [Taibaiella chishuiensis]|uniref:1-deoxy-D-xylulose-5-phosphate synthase n=1 Tax=Taibaiella chishuiensis TaxID=1434707 RepID=A0A2P8D8M0_9BACT|nr:1-deoxy-D-xylulose-5-phosphate synthase [Taibaiella chishuiensis]PSK93511.1 1-deoxy-D-xylulose-5-phosphate synthase [Taibaiella chishuiensis]